MYMRIMNNCTVFSSVVHVYHPNLWGFESQPYGQQLISVHEVLDVFPPEIMVKPNDKEAAN
jgi:hypothetical protein